MPKAPRKKYYAVRVGRQGPNIYETWDEVSSGSLLSLCRGHSKNQKCKANVRYSLVQIHVSDVTLRFQDGPQLYSRASAVEETQNNGFPHPIGWNVSLDGNH